MKEDQRRRLCDAEGRDEVMLLKTEQVVGLGIQVAPRAEKGKEMDSGIKVSDINLPLQQPQHVPPLPRSR